MHLCLSRLFAHTMLGKTTANLGHFVSVLLPSVENIELTSSHNLRDASEAVEHGGVQNAIAVTLKRSALV